jgi:hypothetical protein
VQSARHPMLPLRVTACIVCRSAGAWSSHSPCTSAQQPFAWVPDAPGTTGGVRTGVGASRSACTRRLARRLRREICARKPEQRPTSFRKMLLCSAVRGPVLADGRVQLRDRTRRPHVLPRALAGIRYTARRHAIRIRAESESEQGSGEGSVAEELARVRQSKVSGGEGAALLWVPAHQTSPQLTGDCRARAPREKQTPRTPLPPSSRAASA